MAGPTPVSALIHAATMVTAGVYLIARTHVLFALAPPVQLAVAVIGALTLLVAGLSALVQHDIKRVLAYSTISQIGYMFLALGVGAWSAAVFHLMTHAFFKALLFLAAGVVIHALHHEHDIFRMGGLRRTLPSAFWPFLIGVSSLSALPLVTAGFYSKDLILWNAWSAPGGEAWLWAAGWVGALLTGLYSFRLLFIAFFGAERTPVTRHPGPAMLIPLSVLCALALFGGLLELPPALGDHPVFTDFLHHALPAAATPHAPGLELAFSALAALSSLLGLVLAWWLFLRRPGAAERIRTLPGAASLGALWYADWGFDWLYDRLLVRPYHWLARVNRHDVVDRFYDAVAWTSRLLYAGLSRTQSGRLRWYAAAVVAGSALLLGLGTLL